MRKPRKAREDADHAQGCGQTKQEAAQTFAAGRVAALKPVGRSCHYSIGPSVTEEANEDNLQCCEGFLPCE